MTAEKMHYFEDIEGFGQTADYQCTEMTGKLADL